MLNDSEARRIALTDLRRTLLVEAGAGSGKTSLMAGRIVSLLANGVHPSNIAAVSFTEMAAAELLARVSETVDEVIAGTPPADIKAAYDGGNIDAAGKAMLEEAQHHLGEMTCTTIHGFCKRLLKPYPVEANMDPGASILDAAQASLLFNDVFEDWIRNRLSGYDPHQDLITEMVTAYADAKSAIETIRALASQLRGSPDLEVDPVELDHSLWDKFIKACEAYNSWIAGLGFEAEGNDAIREAFQFVVNLCHDLKSKKRPHSAIVSFACTSFPSDFVKADGGIKIYKMKGKWQAAAPSKKLGEEINETATQHYNDITKLFEEMRSNAASAAISMLSNEIQPMLALYDERKRAGAALDFEDLLISTREMLRYNPEIAKALGERYKFILVDEFQDTDPVQAEVFKHLSFDHKNDEWVPRAGSIFLVGDPKQGIYRFRGADVKTYLDMRTLLEKNDPSSILKIYTNFRSNKGILDYVNDVFEEPLNRPSQPGYTGLAPFREDVANFPSISTLQIDVYDNMGDTRDAEAKQVAEMCKRMIGSLKVYDKKKGMRDCLPSDIALLAPTGSELWRYEHALEEEGISVATQAGKGLFQRQEIQDLIAITRVLADQRDQLALGALLRGPLVGLTETELLDASHRLPNNEDGSLSYLHIGMSLSLIENPVLRSVMHTLNDLRERAPTTTPHDIISQAVDALHVRATLRARHIKSPNRTLANVDRFLEMSRPFAIRGLRAFSDEMRSLWEDAERMTEARPDGEDQSVSIITMHSAKGLEWPVVFIINTMTELKKSNSMVVDVSARTLTMPFFDIQPTNYFETKLNSDNETFNERIRLLYVATTRARDLLIIPSHAKQTDKQWATIVPLKLEEAAMLSLPDNVERLRRKRDVDNFSQDQSTFNKEAILIGNLKKAIIQKSPSRHEPAYVAYETLSYDDLIEAEPVIDPAEIIKGSAERGTIMHKLMEEVLTGELEETLAAIEERAVELTVQYMSSKGLEPVGIDAAVIAKEIMDTLDLQQIREIRPRLYPEVSTYSAHSHEGNEIVVNGIMDASEILSDDTVKTVIDWKSDRNASDEVINQYSQQVRKYMEMNGATRGLIVFMAMKKVVEI